VSVCVRESECVCACVRACVSVRVCVRVRVFDCSGSPDDVCVTHTLVLTVNERVFDCSGSPDDVMVLSKPSPQMNGELTVNT